MTKKDLEVINLSIASASGSYRSNASDRFLFSPRLQTRPNTGWLYLLKIVISCKVLSAARYKLQTRRPGSLSLPPPNLENMVNLEGDILIIFEFLLQNLSIG